jgi:AcrR family transcriptional regulator
LEKSVSQLEKFVDDALSGDIKRLDKPQRQARILAATIAECSHKSFRTASMAGIAKRARVSTASLYRDFGTREKLLEDATMFAAPLVANELVMEVEETMPRARLVALLIRHCQIFDHPHASWLYRAHVSGELATDSGIVPLSKMARTAIEAFWAKELTTLCDAGLLVIPKMTEAINFVLGAVQRRTLIAMLLFGTDDVAKPDLETSATSAVDWLVAQFGTEKLHKVVGI